MRPKISVQVATVFRESGYVHRTLASLRETGFFDDPENLPLHLVVGSPDSSYLDEYRRSSKEFVVHAMSEEEAERLKMGALTPMQRAGLTHSRCLDEGCKIPDAPLVLVVEDDVRFAKGWMRRIERAVGEATSSLGDSWVMCLYTPLTDEPTIAYQQGRSWYRKNYDWFFGTQGTLYPIEVARSFSAEIMRRCVNPYTTPYDLALAEHMRANKIPIVATAPCLVQHIGEVSQGVCNHFHQSKSFMETIPEEGPSARRSGANA